MAAPNDHLTLTKNSTHISIYCGNNLAPVQTAPRFGSIGTTSSLQVLLKYPVDSKFYGFIGQDSSANFSNSDARGFYVLTRTANNILKAYKNSSLLATNTITDITTLPNESINLGRSSTSGGWVSGSENNYEHRLVSIGDGLTDAEAANLYTAVQAYQTALNRQV